MKSFSKFINEEYKHNIIQIIYCSERKVERKIYANHNSLLKSGKADTYNDIFVIVDNQLHIYRNKISTLNEWSDFQKYIMKIYGLTFSELSTATKILTWRKDIEPYLNKYSTLISSGKYSSPEIVDYYNKNIKGK